MDVDKENVIPEPSFQNRKLGLNLLTPNINKGALASLSTNVPKQPTTLATANLSSRPVLQSIFRSKTGGAQRVSARRVSAQSIHPDDDEEAEEPHNQQHPPSIVPPPSITTTTTTTTTITTPPRSAIAPPSTAPSISASTAPSIHIHTTPAAPQPVSQPSPLHRHPMPAAPSSTTTTTPPVTSSTPLSAAPVSNNPRFIVNGNEYRIHSQIGRGGTSKVFRVENNQNHPFALKRIDIKIDDPLYESLKNEIQVLTKLRGHAHIIQLYEYEEIDLNINEGSKIILLVLELGQGDLHSFLARQAQQKTVLSVKQLRFIWQSMLYCVQACHQQNIIHLDLKPSNFVFVGNRLKLIDFGIAKSLKDGGTSVITDSQVGTLNYMSPESLEDSSTQMEEDGNTEMDKMQELQKSFKMRRSSDVWSLGIILYQCVYGKTPFADITNMFRKMKAIGDPNHTISFPKFDLPEINKGLLMDLTDIMRACLQRDPSRRPPIDMLLQHRFIQKSSYITSSEEQTIIKLIKLLKDPIEVQNALAKLRNGELLLE